MKHRSNLWLLALTAVLSLAGIATPADCAPRDVSYDYTAFMRHPPRSILVLPPLNHSITVEGPYSWLSTVSRPLAERGYYVFPVAVVDQLMKENGLPTAAEMHQVSPAKLGVITGADAVLFVVLHKYGSEFQLLETITAVEVSARLVDTKSGAVLWTGGARAEKGSNDDKSLKEEFNLLGDLIDAVITQVINSKSDPGRQVARQANMKLFGTPTREIPAGPYLPPGRQKH